MTETKMILPSELSESSIEAEKLAADTFDELILKVQKIIIEQESRGMVFTGVERNLVGGVVNLIFKPGVENEL